MTFSEPQKKLLKESAIAWFVVIFACHLFYRLKFIPFIANNLSLISAVFLLYVPIGIYLKKKEKIDYLDNSLQDFGKSLFLFAVFSAVIFPLIVLGNHYYQNIFFHFSYHPAIFRKPLEWSLFQLLLVALPEEFFFRGYLQGRLNQIFGKPWRLLGVSIGPALLITSLVFAISHSLIRIQWWHLFIFFPALAFGWLREKSGTITAPIFFHALSNAFSYWVALHYF